MLDWIADASNKAALLLDESAEPSLVQRVVVEGYADDLTDSEVEQLGGCVSYAAGGEGVFVAFGLAIE